VLASPISPSWHWENRGKRDRRKGRIHAKDPELHAPVQLPAGALVTEIAFDGYDVDAATNISAEMAVFFSKALGLHYPN